MLSTVHNIHTHLVIVITHHTYDLRLYLSLHITHRLFPFSCMCMQYVNNQTYKYARTAITTIDAIYPLGRFSKWFTSIRVHCDVVHLNSTDKIRSRGNEHINRAISTLTCLHTNEGARKHDELCPFRGGPV